MSSYEDDKWLQLIPPWASTNSAPFVPRRTLGALELFSGRDGHPNLPSNFTLLSKLLRRCAASDLTEIEFPSEERYGIGLGDGTTYKVEKKRFWRPMRESYRWVAAKRAKFVIPNAPGEIRFADTAERNRLRAVLLEIEILSHAPLKKHANIARLLGYSWDQDVPGYAPVLVMELADFGTLQSLLDSQHLSDNERKGLCFDVACGLEALHECMIVHGDVKLENILVFAESQKRFVAKVSDFEHSLLDNDLTGYQGTPIYNAPEVHLQRHYATSGVSSRQTIPSAELPMCDVFSYGLLVFEVFCNGKRYHEFEESKDFVLALTTANVGMLPGRTQDTLQLSLDFLERTRLLQPPLKYKCEEIFRHTLRNRATHRLRRGWKAIKSIVDEQHLFEGRFTHPSPMITQASSDVQYSVLEFSSQISLLSKDYLGDSLWAELVHLAHSAQTQELRGKASFELCILYAIGACAPNLETHDVLNWMACSALFGYDGSFIAGKRVYEANSLRVPDALYPKPALEGLYDQIMHLESLPRRDFYCNAVSVFLTRAQRLSSRSYLRNYETEFPDDLEAWARVRGTDSEGSLSSSFAERHFLIHQAVLLGQIDTVELLLTLDCDINLQTPDGRTALHLACQIANMPLIDLLLSNGADASKNDARNISPLHWLVLWPSNEICRVANALVTYGADVNSMMLEKAAVFYDCLGLELRATPLWWACLCRNRVAVSELLSLNADVYPLYDKAKQHRPFNIALGTVCCDIVELFFTQTDVLYLIPSKEKELLYNHIGVGFPNEFQRWVIHGDAYEKAYTEVIDLLARYSVELPIHPQATLSPGSTFAPLTRAAMGFNLPLAKALVKRGANVNERDYTNGTTALFQALLSSAAAIAGPTKMLQMVDFLIKSGASVEPESNAPTHRLAVGEPLLHFACMTSSSVDMIHLVAMRAPAHINSKQCGRTPLHHIAAGGIDDENVKAFHMLLDLGADPDMETDHRGDGFKCCLTPIAYAVSCGDGWDLTQHLLDHDVSTDIGLRGGHRRTLVHLLINKAFLVLPRQRRGEDTKITSRLENLLNHPVARERDLANKTDCYRISPISSAVTRGLPHCVRILLDVGVKTNVLIKGKTLLQAINHFQTRPPSFVFGDTELEERREDHEYDWQKAPYQTISEYTENLREIKSMLVQRLQSQDTG